MNSAILAVFAVLVALTSGAPTENERMTGGQQVSAFIPYLASITVDDEHVCGGFIYSQDWIVTAASCVYGVLPSQVKAVLGQVSMIQEDPSELPVSAFKIFINEGYDNVTKLNDVAMLQMATPIDTTIYSLIYYDELDETIPSAEFAGWGATMEGGLATTKLRKMTLSIPGVCSSYSLDDYNPTYMVCAGDPAKDAGAPCHFDEGSPLVQKIGTTTSFAVGIMSKNAGCGTGFTGTIFTRLTSYYPWFNKLAGLQP